MSALNSIASWVLAAVVCSIGIKIMLMLDSNKKAFGHVPGQCRYVEGINRGARDIELILPDGIALITSGGKLVNNNETSKFKGRIYVYEWTDTSKGVKRSDATPQTPKAYKVNIVQGESREFDASTFNPQGISSFVSKGRINVYVVNRAPDHDRIESFLYDKQKRTLYHSKSIKNDAIYAAHDILAIGPDKFYVTNAHYFKSWWLQLLEIYLLLNLGNIVYYDGKANVVDKWLSMPTGLATDKTRRHLYVSNAMQEFVRLYNISGDQSLVKQVDMSLMSTPEHLFVDPESSELWVAAHPIMHEYLKHIPAPKTTYSSSQIIHIKVQGAMDRWILAETFADDGHLLNASSAVVRYQNQLLIGSMFNKLLLCDLMHEDFQN